jgi:hypothetical protein
VVHHSGAPLKAGPLPTGILDQIPPESRTISHRNQWTNCTGIRRVFDYAEVELSNNLAENSMRPIALGRKNWLHVGSVKAGPKVAAILSVVESCRRLRVPVREYLLGVLPGLDAQKLSEIARLTPANWSAARA